MSRAFDAPFWNLLQTLAWIHLADREFVEAASDRAVVEGRRPSIMSLAMDVETRPTRYPSLAGSMDDLIKALAAGRIESTGLRYNRGDPEPIPQAFWTDARFGFSPEAAYPQKIFRPHATHWHGLRFPSDTVRSLWPPYDTTDTDVRERTAPTLSFRQIAGRWLAEQQGTGLTAEDLSVDLIRAAEAGTFSSKPIEGEPKPGRFDPRLGRVIHTIDQRGEVTGPHWIRNYVASGGDGKEHDRRLIAARDISISIQALAEWLRSEDGFAWMRMRGLTLPSFVPAPQRPAIQSKANAERACYRWLVTMMKTSHPDGNKSDYKAQAQQHFEISGRRFDVAWANAVRDSGNLNWSKAGRKQQKPKSDC